MGVTWADGDPDEERARRFEERLAFPARVFPLGVDEVEWGVWSGAGDVILQPLDDDAREYLEELFRFFHDDGEERRSS